MNITLDTCKNGLFSIQDNLDPNDIKQLHMLLEIIYINENVFQDEEMKEHILALIEKIIDSPVNICYNNNENECEEKNDILQTLFPLNLYRLLKKEERYFE